MIKYLKYNPFIAHLLLLTFGIYVALRFNSNQQSDVISDKINIFFFLIVFFIFCRSYKFIVGGIKIDIALKEASSKIEELKRSNTNILDILLNTDYFFKNDILDEAFKKYKNDYVSMKNDNSEAEIDIERYINYELIENSINTHFLNLVSGTMTGLGILGTFLGLSFGLSSFNLTGSSDSITKEIQPLMAGIKVAFHTSIYGLIFSISYNFYYREILKEFSSSISVFINVWQNNVVPISKNGGESSLIKYQKQIKDCLNKQYSSNCNFFLSTGKDLKIHHDEKIKKFDFYIEQQTNLLDINRSLNKTIESIGNIANQISDKFSKTILFYEEKGKALENTFNSIIKQQAKIISLQEHQNEVADSMSAQMAEQVSFIMKETIIPEIQEMRKAVVNFAEAAQDDHIKGVKKLVDEFIVQMNSSLGESFTNLSKTLDEINEWQKKNIEATKTLMSDMGNTATGMNDINKHIDEAASKVAKYAQAVEQMQNSVNSNLMSLNVQSESSRELIESQKDLISKMIETEESAKNSFMEIIEKIDKQSEVLNDFNSSIESKIKDEFNTFASNIENVTNAVVANNSETIEKFKNKSTDCINTVMQLINENQYELKNQYEEVTENLKCLNNETIDSIKNSNAQYIEKISEITTNSQNTIDKSYNEFSNTLKDINKQVIEDIKTTNNRCIIDITNTSIESQNKLSNGFANIASSITNTTITIQNRLFDISEKMDKQLDTLNQVNNGIKQELQNEVSAFAKELRSLTNSLANECKTALESMFKNSEEYVDKLENMTLETQNQLQHKFDDMESIIRIKLEKVGEINGRLVDDISSAAINLGNAANKLDDGLTGRIKETFATFDRELAEIAKHFSGTIKHVDNTVGNTKATFDLLSNDIDDKFEKMQTLLDQYLEYADKLHHNIEYKFNQLKNEDK